MSGQALEHVLSAVAWLLSGANLHPWLAYVLIGARWPNSRSAPVSAWPQATPGGVRDALARTEVPVSAALWPVERIRARDAGITHIDPTARLPVPPASDEISRPGTTFNDLVRRLHEAVDRERQFVADAGRESAVRPVTSHLGAGLRSVPGLAATDTGRP
ncbi:hypothetical protein [Nocardia sp. NPDC049707]|uniref:hypothetical protein n=1 Tax=Nocardia sp. NPDC049707 TaxID=3154735 RepID=UPI003424345D